MAEQLAEFVKAHPRLVVITGAGVSVGSGIPTYRDDDGKWLRSDPIKHQEFVENPRVRQRYWNRSMAGWPAVRDARPGAAHRALAMLELAGYVDLLVTQNVDRLHQRAGHRAVVDLHGRLDNVRCLQCDLQLQREVLQHELARLNPALPRGQASLLPDGDADVSEASVDAFAVPACVRCSGILIPDVVFFGGSVPRERVAAVTAAIDKADAVLAVGSSLTVFSSFRFCRLAHQLGKPLALLNRGTTRADDLASLKLELDCDEALAGAVAQLAV